MGFTLLCTRSRCVWQGAIKLEAYLALLAYYGEAQECVKCFNSCVFYTTLPGTLPAGALGPVGDFCSPTYNASLTLLPETKLCDSRKATLGTFACTARTHTHKHTTTTTTTLRVTCACMHMHTHACICTHTLTRVHTAQHIIGVAHKSTHTRARVCVVCVCVREAENKAEAWYVYVCVCVCVCVCEGWGGGGGGHSTVSKQKTIHVQACPTARRTHARCTLKVAFGNVLRRGVADHVYACRSMLYESTLSLIVPACCARVSARVCDCG